MLPDTDATGRLNSATYFRINDCKRIAVNYARKAKTATSYVYVCHIDMGQMDPTDIKCCRRNIGHYQLMTKHQQLSCHTEVHVLLHQPLLIKFW